MRLRRVAVGGEMKVTGGTVNWISNKSGHYHPSNAQLIQFLHFLQKDYGDLGSVEIKAGFTDIKDGTKADKVPRPSRGRRAASRR